MITFDLNVQASKLGEQNLKPVGQILDAVDEIVQKRIGRNVGVERYALAVELRQFRVV